MTSEVQSLSRYETSNVSNKFNDGAPGEKVIVMDSPAGLKQLILCFKACVKMKLDNGVSVHNDRQNSVAKSEFQAFRLAGCDPDQVSQNVKAATVTSDGADSNTPFGPKH